ncbi:MAG TPA: glycosyltransferase, partial [Aquificae bacterium]|nr:glycosyltransferase [Aquificota bacterium]
LLLKAFSKLDNNYRLYILGEGEEKDNLIKLADKLNIKDRVYFLGFQKNPYKYLAQADLMVLSSKVEGLPNVVLEANALGIPVVAFDCPGGTREIIKNGLNGFLVKCGDVDKLAFYIEKAVNYNWDKSKIIKYIKENFSVEKIIKKYEDTLLSLLKT